MKSCHRPEGDRHARARLHAYHEPLIVEDVPVPEPGFGEVLVRIEGAAFDFVGSDATLELAVRSTRSLGKVSQIGLAGGAARLRVLENSGFEVLFEATL